MTISTILRKHAEAQAAKAEAIIAAVETLSTADVAMVLSLKEEQLTTQPVGLLSSDTATTLCVEAIIALGRKDPQCMTKAIEALQHAQTIHAQAVEAEPVEEDSL